MGPNPAVAYNSYFFRFSCSFFFSVPYIILVQKGRSETDEESKTARRIESRIERDYRKKRE
jgi:hypothetical protein